MAKILQTDLPDRNRKTILSMLSKNEGTLVDFATLESNVDTKLFKQDTLDYEPVIYDGDIALGAGSRKVKSDVATTHIDARLLSLAMQPEISDVLDIMIDELYTNKFTTQMFCEPSFVKVDMLEISDEEKQKLKDQIQEKFEKIYSLQKFDNQIVTNDYDFYKIVKLFFILGKCRYYIEFDNIEKPTSVKHIYFLDSRLYKLDKFEKQKNGTNVIFYRITKTARLADVGRTEFGYNYADTVLPAIALDSQIINIDWTDIDIASNISYVANLERAFNVYRLMERTRIAWAVNNATFRTINVIPVKGLGRAKGLQTLRAAQQKYGEQISFNDENGTLTVNGEIQYKFAKELWVGETSSGRPEFSTVGEDGPDMADMAPVAHFLNRFNKATKVPPALLDRESQNYWANDETQISLEYNRFSKRMDRIRRALSPIVIKPMWAELSLQNPEWRSDREIKASLMLHWHTRDVFSKQLQLAILEKTAGIIDGLATLTISPTSKFPLLSKTLLVKQFLDMNDDELTSHREQILKDIEDQKKLDALLPKDESQQQY